MTLRSGYSRLIARGSRSFQKPGFDPRPESRAPNPASALTLVEVVVALAISSMALAGIVASYLFSIGSAQKASLSLAASARALQRVEETRSARWDLLSWPPVDQLVASNFTDQVVLLDKDATGKTVQYATNITRVSQISTNPPLKLVHVDCVWTFKGNQLLTNSVETCRAPDS